MGQRDVYHLAPPAEIFGAPSKYKIKNKKQNFFATFLFCFSYRFLAPPGAFCMPSKVGHTQPLLNL